MALSPFKGQKENMHLPAGCCCGVLDQQVYQALVDSVRVRVGERGRFMGDLLIHRVLAVDETKWVDPMMQGAHGAARPFQRAIAQNPQNTGRLFVRPLVSKATGSDPQALCSKLPIFLYRDRALPLTCSDLLSPPPAPGMLAMLAKETGLKNVPLRSRGERGDPFSKN